MEEIISTQISSVPQTDLTKLVTSSVPIFCFPEFIEKLPISLTYCFLYMLACVLVIGCGFYFYFHKILTSRTTFQNNQKLEDGYTNVEQNTVGKHGDTKILRGMLPRGSNTPMHAPPVLNGSKSGTRE